MQDSRLSDSALLPSGFADLLRRQASTEFTLRTAILSRCAAWGYALVRPPLCEFADKPTSPPEDGSAEVSAFRFLDPVSHRILALREDMTPQVARLADSRLKQAPRPLRLCYAGEVLRTNARQIDHERQRLQIGAELIGDDSLAAQVEIILLTSECLAAAGVKTLSVDLAWSRLSHLWLDSLSLSPAEEANARTALAARDEATLGQIAKGALLPLLQAAGTAREVLAQAQAAFPKVLAEPLAALEQLVARLEGESDSLPPETRLTADLAESRDFSYQTGPAFSIFAPAARTEVGRGGVYRTAQGEAACGFSVYGHQLRRALGVQDEVQTPEANPNAVYAAAAVSFARCAELRAEGWSVVRGLDKPPDPVAEAKRLNCAHYLLSDKDKPRPL